MEPWPTLVLAPHFQYPIRSGPDLFISRLWPSFSRHVPYVDVLGQSTLERFRAGEVISSQRYENALRSRVAAGTRTILLHTHYLREKLITPAFAAMTRQLVANGNYRIIVCSYMVTLDALSVPPQNAVLCVWTQNDELEWFDQLARSSANPFTKAVSKVSKAWLRRRLGGTRDLVLMHVSEKDSNGYRRLNLGHRQLVVPIGAEVYQNGHRAPLDGKIVLMFVGSLAVRMNQDALELFRERFFNPLKERFGSGLRVIVAGSSPPRKIISLCRDCDWDLVADVSADELHELYATATFTIMPFPYWNGRKLKMMESVGHGVPYLATVEEGVLDDAPYPCLRSDDPKQWVQRVAQVTDTGSDDRALFEYASRNSWDHIAELAVAEMRPIVADLEAKGGLRISSK